MSLVHYKIKHVYLGNNAENHAQVMRKIMQWFMCRKLSAIKNKFKFDDFQMAHPSTIFKETRRTPKVLKYSFYEPNRVPLQRQFVPYK